MFSHSVVLLEFADEKTGFLTLYMRLILMTTFVMAFVHNSLINILIDSDCL